MAFSKLLEKIKPVFDAFLDKLFLRSGYSKRTKHVDSEFFSDEFVRTAGKDIVSAPVSKKIYVNGKEFNIVAFSQQELNDKIQNFNASLATNKPAACLDPSKLLFSNLYTEQKTETKIDEWSEKRDVWIDEYCPA